MKTEQMVNQKGMLFMAEIKLVKKIVHRKPMVFCSV